MFSHLERIGNATDTLCSASLSNWQAATDTLDGGKNSQMRMKVSSFTVQSDAVQGRAKGGGGVGDRPPPRDLKTWMFRILDKNVPILVQNNCKILFFS